LSLVNAILGRELAGVSGSGILARVTFRVRGSGESTHLRISDASLIDVTYEKTSPQIRDGVTIALIDVPSVYHDKEGEEIRGLILAETDPRVDFNDFMILAQHFGYSSGEEGYDTRADLNVDDRIDFADFLIFAGNFGKIAVDAPSFQGLGRLPDAPGSNRESRVSLRTDRSDEGIVRLFVDFAMVSELQGWGLTLGYNSDEFTFIEGFAPEGNLLEASGAEAPLFLVCTDSKGRVSLSSGISRGEAVTGSGAVAGLSFRAKTERSSETFKVLEAILFDPDQLTNLVSNSKAMGSNPERNERRERSRMLKSVSSPVPTTH